MKRFYVAEKNERLDLVRMKKHNLRKIALKIIKLQSIISNLPNKRNILKNLIPNIHVIFIRD